MPPEKIPEIRTGQTPTRIEKDEFLLRWRQNFYDPAFEKREDALEALGEIAWKAYDDSRKSPRTRKAGPGFAGPAHLRFATHRPDLPKRDVEDISPNENGRGSFPRRGRSRG